jgi:hypothetical protein
MKARNKKRRIIPRPLQITTMDGSMITLNSPQEVFGKALQDSEDEVVVSMKELINSDLDGKQANEAAKVTAAIKVIDLLEDRTTPAKLLQKLEKLRYDAVDALRDVVNNGSVAAARANAGAYLLKAIKVAAPAAWPPDDKAPEFLERMQKANMMCAL